MTSTNRLSGDVPISVVTIPCLADNYAYLIHNESSGETALVDAPAAAPIEAALADRNWKLASILVTHHHWDHVQGVDTLRKKYCARVIGHARDSGRLPRLDHAVEEGDVISVCGRQFSILDVSGHTIGHVAFVSDGVAFTADSLMALGCGKVFEGTFEMMWQSLEKLARLPSDTLICSGHEYTLSNARFAVTIEPDNAALRKRFEEVEARRRSGLPTVPSLLSLELETNPFIRACLPEVKTGLGMSSASNVEVFAAIRTRKDNF